MTQIFNISESAKNQVEKILKENSEEKLLKVGVKSGGCSRIYLYHGSNFRI